MHSWLKNADANIPNFEALIAQFFGVCLTVSITVITQLMSHKGVGGTPTKYFGQIKTKRNSKLKSFEESDLFCAFSLRRKSHC